jgi:hypothetical protein
VDSALNTLPGSGEGGYFEISDLVEGVFWDFERKKLFSGLSEDVFFSFLGFSEEFFCPNKFQDFSLRNSTKYSALVRNPKILAEQKYSACSQSLLDRTNSNKFAGR